MTTTSDEEKSLEIVYADPFYIFPSDEQKERFFPNGIEPRNPHIRGTLYRWHVPTKSVIEILVDKLGRDYTITKKGERVLDSYLQTEKV